MKKSQDTITIFYDNSDNSEDDTAAVSPVIVSQSCTEMMNIPPKKDTIKLTSPSAKQLTSDTNVNATTNATTNAILSLKNNPFFHDKRKWDESFTVAEKKELTGNIVKAAKDNDGETYVTLQEEEYTVSQLSLEEDEDESQESDDVDSNTCKKPGRKPMADEETFSDSDQDPKVKRKAQNRAAQRAFRERKERYVKELESKLKHVQDTNLVTTTQLIRENHQLRSIIYRLETENYALKGTPMQPYQYQTTLLPHHPSPSHNDQIQITSSYPNIAPLLTQQQQHHQQPLLPAYLSTSPQPTSPMHQSSLNHMIIMNSSPLQQYPMSPVVSMTQNALSPKKLPLPLSKKVTSKRQHTATPPPPPPQPLEYTFSISTPASLRPSGGAVTSSKHTRSEPIELIQLHPPNGKVIPEKTNDLSPKFTEVKAIPKADDEISIASDNTSSTVNTQQQQQRKNMQQLELDMLDCHIDTEGQFFCEKLYNEVCNDAFNRLLSEPLFDQMGKLNLSISTYPVPIVTGNHTGLSSNSDDTKDETSEEDNDEEKSSTKETIEPVLSPPSAAAVQTEKRLLTCPEIWFLLNQHEKVNTFTTDQLCQAVKELAKCADSGPVLEEKDLYQIMCNMDQGFI